jgi:four helix bundle protein
MRSGMRMIGKKLNFYTMSYRKLAIWQLSRALVIEIHTISLQLPKFELFEEGSQIRRSMKSVKSNIVEGYGRRKYKNDFIKHLVYAHASNDETIDHLETLFETGSFSDAVIFEATKQKLDKLGSMLNKFIQAVTLAHNDFDS